MFVTWYSYVFANGYGLILLQAIFPHTHKLFFKNLENCLAIHVPISFIVSICMGKYYVLFLFVRYCVCIEHTILILM